MKIRSVLCALILISASACGSAGSQALSGETSTTTQAPMSTSGVALPPSLGVAVTVVGTEKFASFDASGRLLFSTPVGRPSGDGRRLVRSTTVGDHTDVEWVSTHDGATLTSKSVAGAYVVSAVSFDGVTVALSDREYAPPASGELAVGRSESNITVLRSDEIAPVHMALKGNVVPEAFSGITNTVILIEFVPAEHPSAYHVRQLSLDSGAVLFPSNKWNSKLPVDELENMAGQRGDHVQTQGGRFLYTLYRSSNGTAFVHALDLEIGGQYCIDLPPEVTLESGTISAPLDGAQLFVLTSSGKLITIETHTTDGSGKDPVVTRVTDLGGGVLGGHLSVTVTGETVYAASSDRITAVGIASGSIETKPTVRAATAMAIDRTDGALVAANDTAIWRVTDPARQLELPPGIGTVVSISVG